MAIGTEPLIAPSPFAAPDAPSSLTVRDRSQPRVIVVVGAGDNTFQMGPALDDLEASDHPVYVVDRQAHPKFQTGRPDRDICVATEDGQAALNNLYESGQVRTVYGSLPPDKCQVPQISDTNI